MHEKIEKSLKKLHSIIDDEDRFYKENVRELLKSAGKKPPKVLYAAAFLDKGSREDLYNWWKMHVKEDTLGRVPKHSHMTIKWKPTPEEVLSLPIGEDDGKTVTVIGYAHDELGQAVKVRVSDSSFDRMDEGHAHITISASEDSDMGFKYSNYLLENGFEEVKSGPELKVRVGVFMTNGEVQFDLDDTSNEDDNIELEL